MVWGLGFVVWGWDREFEKGFDYPILNEPNKPQTTNPKQ